ncbi:MAG: sugar phosphate isomerase/epimerase family protein [Desulfurivibrionaceae bacterium]
MTYRHITSRCFINFPFRRLQQELDFVLTHRIQPEIGLEGDTLYTATDAEYRAVAKSLADAGLRCTLHAPFFDLAPGALDENILAATRSKMGKAFDLIEVFRPAAVVCHLNYEENKHGYKQSAWFKASMETWQELLTKATAHQVPLMLENTYETGPEQHEKILAALDSPLARFCLDVGHVASFAKNSWQDWLPALAPWLGQLHLHDNHGDRDAHLAPGRGSFDFPGLFGYLKEQRLQPLITLEPPTDDDLWESLAARDRMQFFGAA